MAAWFRGGLATVAFCCVANVFAADRATTSGAIALIQAGQVAAPFSLSVQRDMDQESLNLNDGEMRSLQLKLSDPLTIETLAGAALTIGQGSLIRAGTGLNFAIDDRFELGTGTEFAVSESSFQSLGSIHCQNGSLDAVSYRASSCYFVGNGGAVANSAEVNLGARYQVSDNASASVNLFRGQSSYQAGELSSQGSLIGMARIDPTTLSIQPGNPLFTEGAPALGLQSLDTQVTGIDLEFQVGVSMDNAGEMVLGVQLTRVLDSSIQSSSLSGPGLQQWNIAEPYDSASLSVDWNKGAFSGGLQSYYRDSVEFINRNELGSLSTFDVHFTWRAPWNASLSVGASNVLNSGMDDNNTENQLVDPFESVYGRIPYVRYKQDL